MGQQITISMENTSFKARVSIFSYARITEFHKFLSRELRYTFIDLMISSKEET